MADDKPRPGARPGLSPIRLPLPPPQDEDPAKTTARVRVSERPIADDDGLPALFETQPFERLAEEPEDSTLVDREIQAADAGADGDSEADADRDGDDFDDEDSVASYWPDERRAENLVVSAPLPPAPGPDVTNPGRRPVRDVVAATAKLAGAFALARKAAQVEPAPAPPPAPAASLGPTPAPLGKAPREGDDRPTAVVSDPMAPLDTPVFGGRYRMVRRIGEGGMGRVYMVVHAQLGKTFALKIIHDGHVADPKVRESFFREARVASSMAHPNIASVMDFGEDERFGAFMVMEYLEGEMLAELLHREKKLGVRQACEVTLQIADAIHYIHQQKVIHCDLKSENIMLCEAPGAQRRGKLVKLLDFGLARSTTAMRHTGSLSGTPQYVAPERIRGNPPSPGSDIYSLGVLLYEMLAGEVPWDGNIPEVLTGHLEKEPPDLEQRRGEAVDPAVVQLIAKALRKNPAERHKDMAAFLYELRTVMDMLGIGRRSKSHRRVVVDRDRGDRERGDRDRADRGRGSRRDELARQVFDANRLPLAMIGAGGVILAANPAFAKFVMGSVVEVEGLRVEATPLAGAWASFGADLARAFGGQPVRKVIEVDTGPGEVRRLVIWLDPGGEQVYLGVHPLD